MSRTVPSGLATHVAQGTTSLAYFLKITRVDEEVFGLTSHDEPVEVDGLVYVPGFDPSTVVSTSGLSIDNLESNGLTDPDIVEQDDIEAGVWDFAEIRVFLANWKDPTQGVIKELHGWLGEFTFDTTTGGYTVELRNLAGRLNTSIGELVAPGCQATLGDARCKMDLTDYTATGEVTAATDKRSFDTDLSGATVRLTPSSTGAPPAGYFDAGLLTWLTGANAGRRMEVKTSDIAGAIVLQLPMVSTVAPGDTFSVSAGCVKSREICVSEFGNIVNFRGFPDLPGIDQVNRFGGQ
jgi:uncharacterized phage protein (TIGR02218 family)